MNQDPTETSPKYSGCTLISRTGAVGLFIVAIIALSVSVILALRHSVARIEEKHEENSSSKVSKKDLQNRQSHVHRAALISPGAFEEVARRSKHLIPQSSGGWASELDATARGHSDLSRARDEYASGVVVFDTADASCTQIPSCTQALLPPPPLRPMFSCLLMADRLCVKAGLLELAEIPWKIAVLRDSLENGYPHTLESIVCLPRSFAVDACAVAAEDATENTADQVAAKKAARKHVLKILIHEKVHVFQRLRPDETQRYVKVALGCQKRYRREDLHASLRNRLRSNPDLDDWIYTCKKEDEKEGTGNSTWVMAYDNERPRTLANARVVHAIGATAAGRESDGSHTRQKPDKDKVYEHPYEEMAYQLSEWIVLTSFDRSN